MADSKSVTCRLDKRSGAEKAAGEKNGSPVRILLCVREAGTDLREIV
jgi:hypothetical protein